MLPDPWPFTSPDAIALFMVRKAARDVQHAIDHPMPVLASPLDDIACQAGFIDRTLQHLALRGSVLDKSVAGTPLRYA